MARKPTKAIQPLRRTVTRALGHPLPEGPLDHGHSQEERADRDDRGVGPGPSADRGEREEEREDHEPEAGQREERPAFARDAERDREAERGKEAVRRAEAAPGDDGQDDEEDESREALEVDGGD